MQVIALVAHGTISIQVPHAMIALVKMKVPDGCPRVDLLRKCTAPMPAVRPEITEIVRLFEAEPIQGAAMSSNAPSIN